MSWYNDPYRHPLPYEYSALGDNHSYEAPRTIFPAPAPAQYNPSHFAPSWNFTGHTIAPWPRLENYENTPPLAEVMLGGGAKRSKKRKQGEPQDMYMEDKRIRVGGAQTHQAQYSPQYQPTAEPMYNMTHGAQMAYVPATGTYQAIGHRNMKSTAPAHASSGAPWLPGAARYEQQLSRTAPPPANMLREMPRKQRAPETAPPPSSQDRTHHITSKHNERKHPAQSSRHAADVSALPRGTQYNPVEIPSSPERKARSKSSKRNKKFYAVAAGHVPGVYKNWADVETQIKGYSGARQQGFATHWEALIWLEDNRVVVKPQLSSGGGFARSIPKAEVVSQVRATDSSKVAERALFPPGGLSAPMVPNGARLPHETPDFIPFPPTTTMADLQQYKAKTTDAAADVVPIVDPPLCKEQAELVDLILSGRNVFYTGSAGCGKSTVLKSFVRRFRERGMRVDIVAPTGRAALDINGSTTWTYAGWTPDHHKKPLLELRKAGHGKFVRQRMKETDVLVVDEISMVENLHFERLNAVMKEARGDGRAFGGVQLIVTGDFCQLPPVKPFGHCIECGKELIKLKDGAEYRCSTHGIYYDIDKWAFRSKAWEECDFAHVNLSTIHRQNDVVFIDILQKLRIGNPLLPKDRELLLKHEHQTRNAIMLFPTRAEVKRVNDEMFNKLRSQPRTYMCLDHFKWNEHHRNLESKKMIAGDGRSLQALADHRYEPQMQLKKGMLVVLLHNLDLPAGLVNGSQGTIQGFEDYDPTKMPKATGKGKESDVAHTGAALVGDYAALREQQMKAFVQQAPFKKWPIVTFLNGVTRTIFADCTVNELGDKPPYSLLSRTQIPLMAAWAMTTHKSQGMTLNRVRVDLGKAFEEGQAYVALSRARSLEGLEVISLPPPEKMGSGNPQVKEFLRNKFGI